MGGFFKKLFKENGDDMLNYNQDDIINKLSEEIMTEEAKLSREIAAEEDILNGEESVDTNKLPDIPSEITTEIFTDFSCYKFYSASDVGMVRKSNQDSVLTGQFTCHSMNRKMHWGMAMVADGMGGLAMGEVASSSAIASVSTFMHARLTEYIQSGMPQSQVILQHMKNALRNANNIVLTKGEELGEEIGTTFTFTCLLGNVAYFGHVGDSRAYIIDTEDKTMEKVTRDHSLVGRMIEMGQLTEQEAKSHPRRNEIYRMLGLRDEVEVDAEYRIIRPSSVIVLVSDGLWEFVDDSMVLEEIVNSSDLSKSVQKLIDMANGNGGQDNISVVIVKPCE